MKIAALPYSFAYFRVQNCYQWLNMHALSLVLHFTYKNSLHVVTHVPILRHQIVDGSC